MFGEDRIQKKSLMKYYPVSVNQRTDTVKMIQRIKLNFDDSAFSIGDILKEEDEGFETKIAEKRTMPYLNNMWNSITYEVSMNRIQLNRSVYGFLDFLGDLGGLMACLGSIFLPTVYMLTYRGEN